MKYLNAKDLPEILDSETIKILVLMALEFPKQTFDWAEVSEVLKERNQLDAILEEVEKQKNQIESVKNHSMTKEEKIVEMEKWKNIKSNNDPNAFYGNMGQPETPEEYKKRYGVLPPKKGNSK
ncbi:MAG: hypothetical protein QE487_07950 [Fluviicola sp.]|nr:hypothetical protein [Fluviicola sp.]